MAPTNRGSVFVCSTKFFIRSPTIPVGIVATRISIANSQVTRSHYHRHDHRPKPEPAPAGALGGQSDLRAKPLGIRVLLRRRAREHGPGRAGDLPGQLLLVGRDAAGDDVDIAAAHED